jgi:hypothetical protein
MLDPELSVIDAYGLRNTDVPELSLHAAYLIGTDGRVEYRKVARRRVAPDELLFAIDGAAVSFCAGSCEAERSIYALD